MSKYIIDIGDAYVRHALGRKLIIPVIINNDTEYWVNTNIQLTPYTEPDTEKVREEAFKNGYDAACKDIDIKSKINAAYRKGLEDAWEAARKICTNWVLSDSVLSEIFGMDKTIDDIMKETTASEAIEKIRAYEKEKEGFHVGDEFENGSGQRFVIIKMDGNKIDRYIDEEGKTYCLCQEYRIMRKTGRHFPEIAEVLAKMKEESNEA